MKKNVKSFMLFSLIAVLVMSYAAIANASDHTYDASSIDASIDVTSDEAPECSGLITDDDAEDIDPFNVMCCGCWCSNGLCCGANGMISCCRVVVWPVPASQRITQFFGPSHNGVDVGASRPGVDGDSVVAFISGDVIASRQSSTYGEVVYINSSNVSHSFPWIQHRYAHLQEGTRIPNGSVAAGQLIGRMGNTGMSTATHLHFETRRAFTRPTDDNSTSTPIDPRANFFPHIRSFIFDINSTEVSNHFEIFVSTMAGEYFTLDNLSIMTPDEITQLDINPESIQYAIDLFGFDGVQSYLEGLVSDSFGMQRTETMTNQESILLIKELFQSQVIE